MQQIDGGDEIMSPRLKPKTSFLVKPVIIDITSLCAVTSSFSIHLETIKTIPLQVSQYFPLNPGLQEQVNRSFSTLQVSWHVPP